jgi:hypothetical protein
MRTDPIQWLLWGVVIGALLTIWLLSSTAPCGA